MDKISYKSKACGCVIQLREGTKIKWKLKGLWDSYARVMQIDGRLIHIQSHHDKMTTIWVVEKFDVDGVEIKPVRGFIEPIKYLFSYLLSKLKDGR